jgi:hypothetical protein
MKLSHIRVENFLGARKIDVSLTQPVTLFSGHNGAGKSSLQEAIRMALAGESVRVSLKKDYARIIREGAETGYAQVDTVDGGQFSIVLPDGIGNHAEHPALPYVLDAQRFSLLSENERRAFLFGLINIRMDGESVKKRLLDKGLDAEKVGQIAPFLRAGFDAAEKEAASRARESKSAWRAVTNENWGKEKAGKWHPNPVPKGITPAHDADRAENLANNAREKVKEIDQEIAEANQALGKAKRDNAQIEERKKELAGLEAQAAKLERIKEKLARDEAELQEWQEKVEATRAKASGAATPDLVHVLASSLNGVLNLLAEIGKQNGEIIEKADAALDRYVSCYGEEAYPDIPDAEPDPEARACLPEYEKALHLMERTVENDRRDLAAAERADAALKEAASRNSLAPLDIKPLEINVAALMKDRESWQFDVEKYQRLRRESIEQEHRIKQASKHHADVLDWLSISAALAPDGIPGEILSDALTPINQRLVESADLAEWLPVIIAPDMRITYGGRDYALISESEKWRADAMIAEAVSVRSGVKLLALDRFDVLDLKGRKDAICWLNDTAANGDLDTALLFGTLKSLPGGLPPRAEAFWIENGTIPQLKEAA